MNSITDSPSLSPTPRPWEIATALGPMRAALSTDNRGVTGLSELVFVTRTDDAEPNRQADETGCIALLRRELAEYFAGRTRRFTIPLILRGTEFQRRVWHELCRIPYGQTVSYSDLANKLGVRNGQRAVGLANGSNPVAVIVPCHRVIERGGGLGGYGGGLDRKRALLALESGTLFAAPSIRA